MPLQSAELQLRQKEETVESDDEESLCQLSVLQSDMTYFNT